VEVSGRNEAANVLRFSQEFANMRNINEGFRVCFSVNVDFHIYKLASVV
jgi:hypothetical protein